jgi:hypothetical protein
MKSSIHVTILLDDFFDSRLLNVHSPMLLILYSFISMQHEIEVTGPSVTFLLPDA